MRVLDIDYSSPVTSPGEAQAAVSLRYALILFVVVSSMILFGLTMLYSTSFGVAGPMYFKKQLLWCGVGVAFGVVVFLLGYRRVVALSPFIMIGVALLLAVALGFPAVKGAHRWIKIPHIGNIQPSEFAKVAVCLFLAKYCSEHMRNISVWSFRSGFIPVCFFCGIQLGLVMLGKDLGTTLLLGMVLAVTLFAAGLKLRYLALPLLIFPPLLVLVIREFSPERWSRMTSFMDPERYLKEDGYQLWNSLLALGSGKWIGVGFMNSRLKHKYLPEAHTDFILSIVGEELGLAGMIAVILVYMFFVFVAIQISVNAGTRQGMLLGVSLTTTFGLQSFINIGVVSGALPTKGMPAPFISYGGSNLVVCIVAVSLLLSIALETARPGFNTELINDGKNYLARLWNKWI